MPAPTSGSPGKQRVVLCSDRVAEAVFEHLGEAEYRAFAEVPDGLFYGVYGQGRAEYAEYVAATALLSHAQRQLEGWIRDIPPL